MPNQKTDPIAQKLVVWYRKNHRDLPWRNTHDPYAVWVSEIMLQQTQVATVLPYYERFLAKYPTIETLARTPQGEVLKTWEGLGYYARARNLHAAAQKIMVEHQGKFPDTLDAVHALPGIGLSTAGAILTFAFHKPHPILDGNVKRVLSRLEGITKMITEPVAVEALWKRSTELLPDDSQTAYDFNQALMELGASLCSPKKPSCSDCPWQSACKAYDQGLTDMIPVKPASKKTPHYTIGVGVVWKDDYVLIALRPEEGLLGGLWEFPGGKCRNDESLKECVEREILEETGLVVSAGAKIASVNHAYTHFKITMHAFHCDVMSGTPEPKTSQKLKWVTLSEIDEYAFPKANKQILEALKSHPGKQLTLC